MPQNQDLTLIVWQHEQRLTKVAHRSSPGWIPTTLVGRPHLFDGDWTLHAHVVHSHISSDPYHPSKERYVALLVFANHANELGEDLLSDIFRLMSIVHDAHDISVDLIRVACIKETERLSITRLRSAYSFRHSPRHQRIMLSITDL